LVYHPELRVVMSVGGIVEFIDPNLVVKSVRVAWQPDTYAWDGSAWNRWHAADDCCLASPRAIVYEVGRQRLLYFDTLVGIASEAGPPPPVTKVYSRQGNEPFPPVLHVDRARSGNVQDGTFDHPYRTVRQAIDRDLRGAIISIAAGEYTETPMRFGKPGRVAATGGEVRIR
jgi:hypothetical protein